MNALCRRALRCYRILCAVSTDECSVLLGWNVTEMRADCLYFAEKGVNRVFLQLKGVIQPHHHHHHHKNQNLG